MLVNSLALSTLLLAVSAGLVQGEGLPVQSHQGDFVREVRLESHIAALESLSTSTVEAEVHLPCFPSHSAMVPMRDGVELKTDVYLPFHLTLKSWPVMLSRGPYGNPTEKSCIAKKFTDSGFAAVFQDTRGQHGSQGNFSIFLKDGEDGYDTMDWITAQHWYKPDSGIVTQGGSALGITQLMVAPLHHPAHKGMWVMVGSPSAYTQLSFPGGNLRQQDIVVWVEATSPKWATQTLLEIAANPVDNGFWASGETLPSATAVNTSGLLLTGWFDFMNPGSVAAYQAYQQDGDVGARGKQQLLSGIIGHGTGIPVTKDGKIIGCTAGQLTYPANACTLPSTDTMLQWMHHRTTGGPDADMPTVQYYTLGDPTNATAPGNVWQNATQWPPEGVATKQFFLTQDGSLDTSVPTTMSTSAYQSDPHNPVPTVGGRNLIGTQGVGPFDQKDKVESRADVVSFTTPVLASPMHIAGNVRAHINVSIDTPDASLVVHVTDVYPDGRSMLMMEGDVRLALAGHMDHLVPLTAGQMYSVDVDLGHISLLLNEGHSLRVNIASSCSPKLWVNPQDGTSILDPKSQPRTANITLHHGADTYLEVGVLETTSEA